MFDVIIIGAGMAGLLCGARLAREGLKVLVLEKKPQAGGTSSVFRRQGYAFPMGPLAFSHPDKVKKYLAEAGLSDEIRFRRDHFQLLAPGWDIVFSRPLRDIEAELKLMFPAETRGLEGFFRELAGVIDLVENLEDWHPDYMTPQPSEAKPDRQTADRVERVRLAGRTPCLSVLDRHLNDQGLKNFLGTMGASPPEMSWLNLGLMWRAMAEVGIWTPSGGVHGIVERLQEVFAAAGGEIRLRTPVERILVEACRARGVRTQTGQEFHGRWVVSNADVKRTFLELLEPAEVPGDFRDAVRERPYTGSELCVYLGLDPDGADFGRMRAPHLFLTKAAGRHDRSGFEDFDGREIEVCRWSELNPGLCPPGRESFVLRTGLPYDRFAPWRTGEKKRRPGYSGMKQALADSLLRIVESALPGLSSGLEVREIATPLTYEDWGGRFQGSIAGWSWAPNETAFGRKLLVETPVEGLLNVGLYASTELFLGGVPTALHTGRAAAQIILQG